MSFTAEDKPVVVMVQSGDRSDTFTCTWGALILLNELDAWSVLIEPGSVQSWPVPLEAAAGIKAFLEEGFRQLLRDQEQLLRDQNLKAGGTDAN